MAFARSENKGVPSTAVPAGTCGAALLVQRKRGAAIVSIPPCGCHPRPGNGLFLVGAATKHVPAGRLNIPTVYPHGQRRQSGRAR
jgi:hypothetical protein